MSHLGLGIVSGILEYENEYDTINNPLLQQLPNVPTLSSCVLSIRRD